MRDDRYWCPIHLEHHVVPSMVDYCLEKWASEESNADEVHG